MEEGVKMMYTEDQVRGLLQKKEKELANKDRRSKVIRQKTADCYAQRVANIIAFILITICNISNDNGHSAPSSTGPSATNPVAPLTGSRNLAAATPVHFAEALPSTGKGWGQLRVRTRIDQNQVNLAEFKSVLSQKVHWIWHFVLLTNKNMMYTEEEVKASLELQGIVLKAAHEAELAKKDKDIQVLRGKIRRPSVGSREAALMRLIFGAANSLWNEN
ncbi:hypothetical protein BDK51DRAFT_32857 [Blyttiomyces helicus]|uniref:Uncharacterized protein n=1 Tax=Blyttiomyces helicus TaxID=388810 RepID=A0A4P9WQI4_9FUNG|nr:hypothetical protein BDK51DRAFT_32857 [Blyttiomyces helicus]|eukprot:RKO93136.1 hypothetical protein BDK51DRAFT_32857 [Blyttiomyces helicus]